MYFLLRRISHLHPKPLPTASHPHHLHPCPQQAELFVGSQQPLYHCWQARPGDRHGFLILRLHRYTSPTLCQNAAWNLKWTCGKIENLCLSHPHWKEKKRLWRMCVKAEQMICNTLHTPSSLFFLYFCSFFVFVSCPLLPFIYVFVLPPFCLFLCLSPSLSSSPSLFCPHFAHIKNDGWWASWVVAGCKVTMVTELLSFMARLGGWNHTHFKFCAV